MNKVILFSLVFLLSATTAVMAQKADTTGKEKKSLIDKATDFGNELIAGPEHVDTFVGKFVQDNLSINVPPIWRDKGTMMFNDLKLNKTDKPPFVTTLPEPQKKLVQGVILTLNTVRKSPEEKKQQVLTLIKQHLTEYYKMAGTPKSAKEIADQANTMIVGNEKFMTNQGVQGDLYLIHDIQAQQANFIILYLVPGAKPGSTNFVEMQYYKYIYETTFPDDIMDWRTFLYPDDQQVYVDFTKKMLKTLVVR